QADSKIIFTPFFHNKNIHFSMDSLKGKIEIIAYMGKSVPESFKCRSIIDLELYGLLTAVDTFKPFTSTADLTLLTDSMGLYALFQQRVWDSKVKIKRWVLKL
ncbi:hypothetical protein DC007_14790, partial [Enterococcus faecalis]